MQPDAPQSRSLSIPSFAEAGERPMRSEATSTAAVVTPIDALRCTDYRFLRATASRRSPSSACRRHRTAVACASVLSPERTFDLSGTRFDPLSTQNSLDAPNENPSEAESLFSSGIRAAIMERLWSLAGATGRNRWQMRRPRKLRKQAKTVAVGCHRLRPNLDGKEGVDGSSPSEGSRRKEVPANRRFCCLSKQRRALPYSVGTTVERTTGPGKCLQIGLLPGTTEHLPEQEGITSQAAGDGPLKTD
jgi:hypothetical protein